jgi:hypothetical protein
LSSLEQEYDIVIYFFSKYTASGAVVANDPCCWWGINQLIAFPNHLTRRSDWPASRPNFYLLHESLHDYESYNHGRLHFYNGADGTHGAGTHGYVEGANGEEDFLLYYRNFMRNQVAELNTMRAGVSWSGPLPTSADLWVGLFDTFRRDVNWQATPPIAGALLASSAKGIVPAAAGFQPSCALPVPANP